MFCKRLWKSLGLLFEGYCFPVSYIDIPFRNAVQVVDPRFTHVMKEADHRCFLGDRLPQEMPEYTRGAPFGMNALRHFQDYLCLPPTILSALLAYEFSQNHPDTGPSPEGRSIGHVRDKSAPTGGWMILLICFSWPISYTYLAMVFIKVSFLLCDFVASLKKITFLSIFLDALDLAFSASVTGEYGE